jgi:hypothetical protein
MCPLASGEFKLAMRQRLPKSCSDGSSAYTLPLRLREGNKQSVVVFFASSEQQHVAGGDHTRRRSARSLYFVFDSIRRTFGRVQA